MDARPFSDSPAPRAARRTERGPDDSERHALHALAIDLARLLARDMARLEHSRRIGGNSDKGNET